MSPSTSKQSTSSSPQSDKKDAIYEHMESYLFKFLKTKIPFGADDLELIQYYSFVKKHKNTCIEGYCDDNNIFNKSIVKEWYVKIVKDVDNWRIIIDAIEQQMELSDNLNIKLKETMKNELISYANDKKDLRQLKDVHNVIQSVKVPIIEKLSLSHNPSHLKIIKSLYHDIIKEKVFLEELSRIYNNILSNKFDNDNIDNNSNEGNTNHHIDIVRKTLKRKCNDAVQTIKQKSTTKNTLICKNSNKKKKAKISNNIMIEKNKVNDKKKISVRKTSIVKNNNNNKNYKNIDDDTTFKNKCAKSMEGELFVVI